ncbi:MAG: DegT/DnrJ/EryC1/StrS family aminotransferase [Deltaproteobacteria bacterium]|nr:DegT/DnrJ/EryC1/StrS family aminotransferase [Deltaproteobacteria bacterium]
MERIPVAGPWITEKEVRYVADAAQNAWYANANVYNDRFEKAFAEFIGTSYAISLPSCTSAIHLSLLALGVGPGDEVVVPDATWIASAAPVSYVGATPVFADMDPQTWCMDPASLEACITPRTKAVIVVDLYGNMPDMDGILEVATRHGLPVIEDAAEAFGSEYGGRKAGSLGRTGVFSFHGSKTLTTGEGGMLVTDDKDLYQRCLFLRDHGRVPGDTMFENTEVAYKYKMSALQAAFGLAQVERAGELVGRKREIFTWYRSALAEVDGLAFNPEGPGVKNSYWMVTVVPEGPADKKAIIAGLSERGVDARPFFNPLSSIKAYAGSEQAGKARDRNRVSYAICPKGVNLPSGMNLDQEMVNRVCSALLEVLGL